MNRWHCKKGFSANGFWS